MTGSSPLERSDPDTGSDPARSPRATRSGEEGEPVEPVPDADDAVAAIRDRAEAVRDREVETALTKLDAGGELPDAQREVVEALAERLVDRLVAVPERSLRDAEDEAGDSSEHPAASGSDEVDDRVETALALFG